MPPGPQASTEALDKLLSDPSTPDWLWIVDPIDGTTNFTQSIPLTAISIGTRTTQPCLWVQVVEDQQIRRRSARTAGSS